MHILHTLLFSFAFSSCFVSPTASQAQQYYGDWITREGSGANECSALSFALGGERIMFALMGTSQVPLPGYEDKGPQVFFILRRGSPYPDAENLTMRIDVDSAATFSFGAEILGGAVHSTISYEDEVIEDFMQYASAGSSLTVGPGNGFYPVAFSLRGSSRALAAFDECMSNL